MLVIWIVVSFVVGMIAKSMERSAALWFVVSLMASPLLAIIVLLVLGTGE